MAMKLHPGPVFIDDMVNSTEVVVNSKTDFVKVVQIQLLLHKPLILYANCYCKIVMYTYREIETTLGISGTSIHSILHEHLTPKKRLESIGRKKCSKNTIAVLRNKSMTSWQVMNRGFKRMSLKVNNSRLYLYLN